RSWVLFFLICCSVAFCKYSYTDKCYRFEKVQDKQYTFYYQYYFNRKGQPLSNDFIVYESNRRDSSLAWSYYYHYVLSDCDRTEKEFKCVSTCESVWFKIWNITAAGSIGAACDKAFIGKYENVMKHDCKSGSTDCFMIVKQQIGTVKNETIVMNEKEPATPSTFTKQDKCIWEYNILGLWSIVTLVIVCVIAVVALIILIGLVVFTQKHRANKRKRLEGSLVRNDAANV
ncbi:hypothetical protein WA588_002278, partial [Blastocystis sp. NMH]